MPARATSRSCCPFKSPRAGSSSRSLCSTSKSHWRSSTPTSTGDSGYPPVCHVSCSICHAAINRFLRQCGIDDDIGGDLECRLVGVALAVESGVSFQGTADVVLGIDDRPVAVDLDSLELGKVLAAAGGLGVLGIGEVEADLGGVELLVAGDGDQGVVGQELGDEAPEGGVEGGTAAGGVAEERAAAGLEVPPQGVEVLLCEGEGGAAVKVDQGVVDQAGVARRELLVVDHHVEGERRFAQCIHEVGDGQGCYVPLAGVLQFGDLQGVALGGVGFEVVDFADDELVGGEFTTGGVVDDVLSDPGGEDDGGVGGAAFGLVPVAGEIFGGIDDDGAAARFEAPEGRGGWVQEVLGTPEGMIIGKGTKLEALTR